MARKSRRRRRISPYVRYKIILEERDKKYVELARENNSMLLAIVAPLFLPPALLEETVQTDTVAISREENMGITYIIDSVEKEFGLPPKLILLIETTGGSGASAYSIARLLRRKFREIIVFVPHYALSAGTMIACIGDEIVMDITSCLGPFDAHLELPKYGFISASALRKGIELTEEYYRRRGISDPQKLVRDRIDPIVQGLLEEAQRAGELYLNEILSLAKYDKKTIEKIVRKLVWEYPSHEFPITMEKAKEIGLRVSLRSKYPDLWSVMEEWLDKLAFHPDNEDHIIAYTYPQTT